MNTKKNINKYTGLCIKAITGNISKNENELLEKWLNNSADNKEEFEKIKKIWGNSLAYDDAEFPDVENEWIELNMALEKKENDKHGFVFGKMRKNKGTGFGTGLGVRWRPALTAAAVVIILVGVLFILNKKTYTPEIKVVVTTGQQNKQIELPDGSEVILNYGSSLQYPETFSGNIREVKLKGEAFFSVAKEKHPFWVLTENAKTTVLGTKFDVWSRSGETRVFVREGIVKVVSKKNNTEGVRLIRNQLSIIAGNGKPSVPKEVDAEFLLGWTSGNLVFDETPLPEIVNELNRYYNVPVIIKNKDLRAYSLTGSFRKMSIDSVLTMICLALDVTYRQQNGGYVIESK